MYIAGAGRSGSTLLARMLGSLPNAFAVGELRYLWDRGLVEARLCGCATPLPECALWDAVLHHAYGDLGRVDLDRTITALNWLSRPSNLPRLLGGSRRPEEVRDLAPHVAALYQAVAATTGAELIIDSSKPPTYGSFIGSLAEIDLSVIHLVRDPRGTAFSWERSKAARDRPSGGLMPRKQPWNSAMNWTLWNAATQALFANRPERVMRLRYEDLISAPLESMQLVLGFLGVSGGSIPGLGAGEFVSPPDHTVAGNPSRLDHGPIALELDDAWRTQMKADDRRIVTAIASPLLYRYRYALRSGARR